MVQSSFDDQRVYYLLFSIFTISITDINSKTSTHWFLNEIKEQIVPGFIRCNNDQNDNYQQRDKALRSSENCAQFCSTHSRNTDLDSEALFFNADSDIFGNRIMQILSMNSRIYYENGTWESKYSYVDSVDSVEDNRNLDFFLIWEQNNRNNHSFGGSSDDRASDSIVIVKQNPHKITVNPSSMNSSPHSSSKMESPISQISESKIPSNNFRRKSQNFINCYPYVNQTQYDHLNGIYYRDSYKFHPEPEVALIFTKKSNKNLNVKVNLENVEAQLTEAKAKKPNSPNVYNNIGNLLRVHGKSREAVECFRCALRLSPHHPDALLNLARVLYNQNYLEDAIYLTRHSLETQPSNRNSWLQHFTLGEIFRLTGHKQEAQHHFLHVLELNPGFRPAKDYLQELTTNQNPITTIYSFCITIFLLSLVFYVLFLNVEFNDGENENQKTHRHFNRGMAMKTLRSLNSRPRAKRNT